MTEKDLQIQELKKEIRELKERVPKWIPVKERLPERSGWYMVATKIGGEVPWVRWYSTREQKFFDAASKALAWMPLPEVYKP